MAKLRMLYMTANDMERWFAATEDRLGWKIKFVDAGSLDSPAPEYWCCRDLPGFGLSESGDANHNKRYFMVPATTRVFWQPFRMNDGRRRYYCGNKRNRGLVGFDPSGVCEQKSIVVTGEFSTTLTDEYATALFKALSHVLRKQCRISDIAAVGEEAQALHWAGYRLNERLGAAPTLDVVIPQSNEEADNS